MKFYEKLWNVMNDSEAIEKSMTVGMGKNSYKAVSEASMLNMIKPLFKKYKLIIFPIDGDMSENVMVWDKTDFNNNVVKTLRSVSQLKLIFRIRDVESDDFQDVVGFGQGADSQDKGIGKCGTYCLKNALSKTFLLFSGEDTDTTHSDDIGNPPIDKGDKELGKKPISTVKVVIIKDLMKKAGTNEASFLKWAGVKKVEEILTEKFVECTMQLEKAVKAHEAK
ncbi:ERF family protein [Clostridium sp.]